MKIAQKGKRSHHRAFVLPTLILVTLILFTLAATLLASGTSSLRVATHDQQSDQALFAAEAGIVRAAQTYVDNGSLPAKFEGKLDESGSSYLVDVFDNSAGTGDLSVSDSFVIPPGSVYLRAHGLSPNQTRRSAGLLFRSGLQAFNVGALGNHISIIDSTFDAYKSALGDYSSATTQSDLPLLATNTMNKTAIELDQAQIDGDVFVGPGGTKDHVEQKNSTLGEIKALAKPIELQKLEEPEFPWETDEGESSQGNTVSALGPLEQTKRTGNVLSFSDSLDMNFSIDLDKLIEQGPYQSVIGASAVKGQGSKDSGLDYIQIEVANNYYLILRSDGSGTYLKGNVNGGVGAPFTASAEAESLASLLFNKDFAENLRDQSPMERDITNPVVLEPGFYESVIIDSGTQAEFASKGTYTIKKLIITDGATLTLPDDATNAHIIVTEQLAIQGENAVGNNTKSPPKLKISYTGSNLVELSGGSRSYFTLFAPNAKIALTSPYQDTKTRFFGALAGDEVEVRNAEFHFDTSTNGIGEGTFGGGVTVLHRHRL